MAYENGTASNHTDLIAKIITFLTANGWTSLGAASGQTTGGWVRGPGLAGGEQIFVGLQATSDVPNDIYNIEIAGAQGFSAGSAWSAQVGKSPVGYASAWNSSIPYWIVANGQRFVCVFKVSTTYHALYAGKILPYGTPTQYPYPFYIGAESATSVRWSDTGHGFRHFVDPGAPTSSADSGSYLCMPDGSWSTFTNWYSSGGSETAASSVGRSVWPYYGSSTASVVDDRLREMRENIDGTYTLLPVILSTESPSRQVFGELDGCHYVSGFNNAAENIISIDGQSYLVVQNIFRTNRWNYWALKLA